MISEWINSDLRLTLALLPLLGGYLWWVARVRSRRASAEPHCRKCGYIVRSIPSRRCPECGAQLYPGGVTFAGTFTPLRRRTRIELWSAGIILAAAGMLWRQLYANELPQYTQACLTLAVLAGAWFAGFVVLKLRRP